MSDREENAEWSQTEHSASGKRQDPVKEGEPSVPARRHSLTQGLKDGGRTVVTAVGALFKDTRGETYDPEDNPEFVRSRPIWEDDLKKYLPEDESFPSFNTKASPETQALTTGHIGTSADGYSVGNISRPPMVPTLENAALNILGGTARRGPQSLAANRWHRAFEFVKRQNALKRKSMSSPIGTGAKMHGHSLGLIPLSDDTRKMVFSFLYQEYPENENWNLLSLNLERSILLSKDWKICK